MLIKSNNLNKLKKKKKKKKKNGSHVSRTHDVPFCPISLRGALSSHGAVFLMLLTRTDGPGLEYPRKLNPGRRILVQCLYWLSLSESCPLHVEPQFPACPSFGEHSYLSLHAHEMPSTRVTAISLDRCSRVILFVFLPYLI